MPNQSWTQVIAAAVGDGTAIANTTTETIVFPDYTVPANTMQAGTALEVIAFGRHSTTSTPTLTFRARWGGVAGVVLAASEAITTGSGVTALSWRLHLIIQSRAQGSSGTFYAMGHLTVHTSTTAASHNVFGSAGVATPASATVDTTIDKALSITAQWGTANASNTLTGHILVVKSLN